MFLAWRLMIPGQVTDNFILMRYMGWINTYQRGSIIPAAFTAFGTTFSCAEYFLSMP